MSLCSIIILTYNALEYTRLCYESIQRFTNLPYELVFVDNGSTDGTREFLRRLRSGNRIVIENPSNVGFARGCNQGARAAGGDLLLFLNNDTVVTKNWLTNLTACLHSDPRIAAVGPVSNVAAGAEIRTTYKNLTEMQVFACHYNRLNHKKWRPVRTASGFCLMVKKAVFDVLNGFDEQFETGFFEDTDLTLRMTQRGYRVMVAGDTFVHHFGSMSYKANQLDIEYWMNVNSAKFNRKHPT
ncbi:MAG TPA: glycosyltransferase family 2 protein [Bacillota bacterium]|nr:glycosyltransferase family 2 protein [Bacillota bacterium]